MNTASLAYHQSPPGKLATALTKPMRNAKDLALAYSPGVADASRAIFQDPKCAAYLTGRGNLVGVISNGSAVLGLGNIGPLAAKPVMEGKAALFKYFADVDAYNIEIDVNSPEGMIQVIQALSPTFGALNLEDIKAPDCFSVEKELDARLDIPVFHDDQHGTAIVVAAAVLAHFSTHPKPLDQIKCIVSGAGAAAIACTHLLVSLGLKRSNVWMADSRGLLTHTRSNLLSFKRAYAQDTEKTSLDGVIPEADLFLGLSVAGMLTPQMIQKMAPHPLILALANPDPEIMPDVALRARPDATVCTGRSDFPNQINNVLCFPYIFRGALDIGATCINDAMKHACVRALADLMIRPDAQDAATPRLCIPSPFDTRLLPTLAPAVAHAGMESGSATQPIDNFETYRARLTHFIQER